MTPAAQRIYVSVVTGAVTSTLTGNGPSCVQFILRAGAKLEVVFHTAGTAQQLEAATTGRLVLKTVDGADDAALFLDTAWTLTGTDDDAVYTFLGEMDSADLRTALASEQSVRLGASILWKEPSEAYDGASLPFVITVHTNYHRSDDAAPVISADTSFVLNNDATAVEVFISGVSKGFLHLQTTAP